MTAQAGERLIFNGEERWMATEPLRQYLEMTGGIKFTARNSACWRGYIGRWQIKDSLLYLIGLDAFVSDLGEVGMEYLFPAQERVLADWFTGEIRVPEGELLDYVHGGFASMYERDLILSFEKGVLIGQKVIDNQAEYERRLTEKKKLDLGTWLGE